MQNPYDQFDEVAPAAPVVIGTPRPRQPAPVRPVQEAIDQQQLTNAQLEEARKRQEIAAAARAAAAGPKPPKPPKPVPEAALNKLEEQVSALSGFDRAANLFKDDFAGFGAGVENSLQKWTGLGTEGQRDWWADFKANDIRLRNAMFGASLTPGEAAAWEAVTVSPSMAPSEIRANLARRQKLAREMLSRRAGAYKSGPYDQEMVAAVLGEYDPDAPHQAAPLDPTGEGDIGFNNRKEVLSLPEGAEGFPRELEAAIQAGQVRSAADFIAFGKERGFDLDPETAKAGADYLAKGGMPNIRTPQFEKVDIGDRRGKGGLIEGADATIRGAADTMTMGLASEGAAAIESLTGENSKRYNFAVENAVDAYDEKNHPWARIGGQVAGGLALPTGITGAAREAGISAFRAALRSGVPREAAAAMARQAAVRAGAVRSGREGAAYGAAYGAGSGEGNILDRADDAFGGALAGFATGRGVPVVASALGSVSGRAQNAFGEIASRLDISPTPATTGGRTTSALQTVLANAPGSSIPVQAGVEREADQLAAAARETATRMGPVTSREAAGEALTRGARAYDRLGSRQGRRLYAERDRLLGGPDADVTMASTHTAFRDFAQQYPTSPMLEALRIHPAVRRLEAATGDGPTLTLAEATDALSFARGQLRNLRSQSRISRQEEAQVGRLEQAIEDDVMRAAQNSDLAAGRTSGPGSAQEAQRAADAHWRELRRTTDGAMKVATKAGRDDTISGTRVYNDLLGTVTEGKTNLRQFNQIWSNLPRAARRTFSATAFDDLGRATPGQQNADSTAWSFNTFLTNWNKIDDSVRQRLFGEPDYRRVSDIVRYADRLKELGRGRNTSNTARHTLAGAWGATVVSTALTGNTTAAAISAAGFPALTGLGEAFMRSPQARQWLATALRTAASGAPGRAQLRAITNRLPRLAATDPAIEEEVLGLRDKLMETLGTNED